MASLRRDLGVLAAKMAQLEVASRAGGAKMAELEVEEEVQSIGGGAKLAELEVPNIAGGAKLAELQVEEEVPSRAGGAKLAELEVGPSTEQDARQQVWQVEESHITVSS